MYNSGRKQKDRPLFLLFILLSIFFLPVLQLHSAKASGEFYLTDEEKNYISSKKEVTVAILDNWRPFSAKDKKTGRWQGLFADLLEKTGEKTGLVFHYIKADNYREAARLVESGDADLMCAVAYPGAANPYDTDISYPFLHSQMMMIYSKNTNAEDLSDYTLAAVDGYPVFTKNPLVTTVKFAAPTDCLQATRSGQTEMMPCDVFSGMSYLRRYENRELVSVPLDAHMTFSFGIARKEAPLLKPILNKIIQNTSRSEFNLSLLQSRQKIHSSLGNFVYYYPFEIICICLIICFLAILGYTTYTRVRSRQRIISHDYRESYITLANAFGEAAFSYNCMEDRLTLFGAYANRLSMPEEIENFSVYLESPDKKLSLDKEVLENGLAGKYHADRNQLPITCQMTDESWQHFDLIYSVVSTDEAYQRPVSIIGCLKNTEQEYIEQERLTRLGLYDKITGIFNRAGAEAELQKRMQCGEDTSNDILMIVDVDFFKQFNDTYGHQCGDDVLRYTAGQMKHLFSRTDILCRWGGDEFLLYFPDGASHMKNTRRECRALRNALAAYRYEERTIPVTLSMGGTVLGGQSLDDAFKSADEALYLVKKQGRNSLHIIEQR